MNRMSEVILSRRRRARCLIGNRNLWTMFIFPTLNVCGSRLCFYHGTILKATTSNSIVYDLLTTAGGREREADVEATITSHNSTAPVACFREGGIG